MFNIKKIKELEESILYLREKYGVLEITLWELQNPPKHKLGDVFKGCTVLSVYSEEKILTVGRVWTYKLINNKTKEIFKHQK
jgi:hypothetical protein